MLMFIVATVAALTLASAIAEQANSYQFQEIPALVDEETIRLRGVERPVRERLPSGVPTEIGETSLHPCSKQCKATGTPALVGRIATNKPVTTPPIPLPMPF